LSATSFYVYYKIDPTHLGKLRSAVQAMFQALQRECGVHGRWLHRRDDPATYMEVYDGVSDAAGFQRLLAQASEHHGVSACLAPGSIRHAEIFVQAD
jgi:hypothetical protein